MEKALAQKKLTWDPAYPAPFESLWSIIVKVIVLNNMTLAELTELIKRDDVQGRRARAVDRDTEWIDFGRFASLLGIDAKRLTGGTWRAIGIRPRNTWHYSIRRCPECWKRGFHCVLFDLEIVASCPWHRCHLTRSCESCTLPATFSLRTEAPLISKRFCSKCRLVLPDREALSAMERIGARESAMITGYCAELINWWNVVGQRFPDRDLLLSGLLWNGGSEREQAPYLSWQLYQALAVTRNVELFWQFRVQPEPVRHAVVRGVRAGYIEIGAGGISPIYRIRELAGKCYRSLRKHLYKTYVEPHRRCFEHLKGLSTKESLALNGDAVCLVSWAFLIWCMSIEGVIHVDALSRKRVDNFPVRLMGPNDYDWFPLGERLRWCYFTFFSIWHQLAAAREASLNIRVEIFDDHCVGKFHEQCTESCAETVAGETRKSVRFTLLYPDPDGLVGDLEDLMTCRERFRLGDGMIDERRVESSSGWRWAHDVMSFRNCMFIARYPDRAGSGLQFEHITVQ